MNDDYYYHCMVWLHNISLSDLPAIVIGATPFAEWYQSWQAYAGFMIEQI
jgi:hypothetical protein